MQGPKIDCAKQAMTLFLKSLPEDCYLNITRFGSQFNSLWQESKKNSEQTMEEAVKYINATDANLGGTELLVPITAILSEKSVENYPRQLFILTDGEIENTKQVIDYVKANAKTTRVFTLGLGEGVSHELVNGIARAGNGTSYCTIDNRDLNKLIINQLKDSQQPVYRDVTIDWGIAKTQQTPYEISSIDRDNGIVAFALMENVKPEEIKSIDEIKLSANLVSDKVQEVKYTAEIGSLQEYPGLRKLVARSMIRDLEEGRSMLHKLGNVSQTQIMAEIVGLSIKHNIMSTYTSFVLVDDQAPDVIKPVVKRNVPIHDPYARGSYGALASVQRQSARAPMMAMMSAAPMRGGSFSYATSSAASASYGGPQIDSIQVLDEMQESSVRSVNYLSKSANRAESFSKSRSKGFIGSIKSAFGMKGNSEPEPEEDEDMGSGGLFGDSDSEAQPKNIGLIEIIKLQKFAGSYNLQDVIKLIKVNPIELTKLQKDYKNVYNLDFIIATVLVLNYLEQKFTDSKDEWDLVSKKSIAFLDKQDKKSVDGIKVRINSLYESKPVATARATS